MFEELTHEAPGGGKGDLALADGSRVAVIGGGPAGSFFAYFLLGMAERVGLRLEVDVFERKDFSRPGAVGCNHCGGIVSESLVQLLAAEGISLPAEVVQRGIDAYVLHTDVGSVAIGTPAQEKRIAAMYRGSGPRGSTASGWRSFDAFLLDLAGSAGARVVRDLVRKVERDGDRLRVLGKSGDGGTYDLVAGAMGVNAPSEDVFEGLGLEYRPPETTTTFICEYPLGRDLVQQRFGAAMHVFLLDIPRLRFAALIPKGHHVTMCLLGEDIDKDLVDTFRRAPEVRRCFPPGFDTTQAIPCRCSPRINVRGAIEPFADRLVLLGDAAVTRLYKDGIGAAYVSAKAASATAVLQGISAESFRAHYGPACRAIASDNAVGRLIFAFTRLVQKTALLKRGVLRMVRNEQAGAASGKRMSGVLWDTFTGSAPYRDVFRRAAGPAFVGRLLREIAAAFLFHRRARANGGANGRGEAG